MASDVTAPAASRLLNNKLSGDNYGVHQTIDNGADYYRKSRSTGKFSYNAVPNDSTKSNFSNHRSSLTSINMYDIKA